MNYNSAYQRANSNNGNNGGTTSANKTVSDDSNQYFRGYNAQSSATKANIDR